MKKNTNKKRNFIYLAGNISDDVRTYEWREEFTELMASEPNVVIVNPCRNRFNQSLKNFKGDSAAFVKEAVARSQKILRAKDYQLVKISNIIVANLAIVTPDKPMVGTVQELCWAHDIFYVPVIGIHENVTNIYTTHSWIDECVSAWVENVDEAANIVKEFFLGY